MSPGLLSRTRATASETDSCVTVVNSRVFQAESMNSSVIFWPRGLLPTTNPLRIDPLTALGLSWRTHRRNECASHRNAPTTSRSSTNSPGRRGGPSASLSRTPNCASRVDHRPICVRCEDMRAGDAAAPFVSWPTGAKLLNHIRLSSQARHTLPMAPCDLGLCTDGFR